MATKRREQYLTAKQLGILPEERKALIAFAEAPRHDRIMALNGHSHYYNQLYLTGPERATAEHCGTAGCIAGYVFAHAKNVQNQATLRGSHFVHGYLDNVGTASDMLCRLYSDVQPSRTVPEAQRVVKTMLRTGKAQWA